MAKCENCGHNSGFHWKQDGTPECCLICKQHNEHCSGFKGITRIMIQKRYEIQYKDIKLDKWITIKEHSTEFWQVARDILHKLQQKNPFIDWRIYDNISKMEA
jgi:hypothetical protein